MCSLTGVYGLEDIAADVLFRGAEAQQHRGEDGVGLATTNGVETFCKAELGMVKGQMMDLLEDSAHALRGMILAGVAHTRYPTEGEPTKENAQPFFAETRHGFLAYGHNGELCNYHTLRRGLLQQGITLTKSSDSELFLGAYALSDGETLEERLGHAAKQLRGAYSFVGITKDALFAIRDPYGFKPLSVAQLNGGYVVTSETAGFLDIEGAQHCGDVKPGTVVTFSKRGMNEYRFEESHQLRPCVFELIYFARPDSHIAGRNVHLTRVEFGRQVFREYPMDGDVVVAVEDSGRSGAEGLAEESGIPLRRGFIRNQYATRTFIRPKNILRERGVNLKLSVVSEVVRGKRVLLVDDSIVRGNTARSRVGLMRRAGAEAVYFYVTSPKIIGDCYYGIDFHRKELRTTLMPDDEEFQRVINVDGLFHLSLEGMFEALRKVSLDSRTGMDYPYREFCAGCLTREYPVPREA